RIRQEVWQAEHQHISAAGTALGLAPGHTFTVLNAPFISDNGEYLTTEAYYEFEENRYASGDGSSGTKHNIAIRVIPSAVTFRAPPETPWPRTHGPQTAKVVGPKGESIWTDRYGRVKVKFHWDRLAKGDDTSSCWVRVSSAWAGQGYGGVQIPRVGDEVVVDFINGDPDRPIITGRVYNEASMPPWALPAAATQMGFMSRSKDGTPDNANALRFEDKAGEEQLWIQAERNMDTQVKNDESHQVGGNQSLTVQKTLNCSVSGHYNQQTQHTRTELVGDDYVLNVQGLLNIASGAGIRLVSGDSMLILDPNGTISLQCSNLQINASGQGEINTGGTLDLNIQQPAKGAAPQPTPGEITSLVNQAFKAPDSGSDA
ncbi:type VI secretion system tip protein TssI/VgrG, partial [Erwinia amylovora]|uniref:type VI secretion system Vgr family protein n=1 Tax=Erwinia amylovora TaxID=552 RepID=UPI0037DC1DBD